MPLETHPSAITNSFTDQAFALDFLTVKIETNYSHFGFLGLTVAAQESWLKEATNVLILLGTWEGKRAAVNLHDLPSPRTGMWDPVLEEEYPSDSQPRGLQQATAFLAAWLHYQTTINPVNNQGVRVAPLDAPSTAGFSEIAAVNGLIDVKVDNSTQKTVLPQEIERYLLGIMVTAEPYVETATMLSMEY